MARPRVDMYEGREEDAPMPEVGVKDYADTWGRDEDDVVASAASGMSSKAQPETGHSETIVLKLHDGDGYVLPYGPWEAGCRLRADLTRLTTI